MSVAKRIIKQILLSIDYLHRECGYIHTSDLLCPRSLTWSTKKLCIDIKADNILASLPDPIVPQVDKYVQDHQLTMYDNLASCRTIKSQPLTNFNLDLRHLRVRLDDYGEGER